MQAAQLSHIWAKSPKPGQIAGETLVDHTQAVITTMHRLRDVNANLADRVRQPDIWSWIHWACALHDLGKCAAGFQRQLKEDFHWDRRHEVLSLAFLPLICGPAETSAYSAIAAGIVAHHKDADTITDLYPLGRPICEELIRGMVSEVSIDDARALADWLLDLRQTVPRLGDPKFDDPAVFARDFHGRAPDDIVQALEQYQFLVEDLHEGGSDPRLLASLALRGLVVSSDHIGSAHQWMAIRGPFTGDSAAIARPTTPWSHQLAAEQTVGSAMFVAPTGSGKTETALLWACHQDSVRRVSHLFYVLPYQASMNAMAKRLHAPLGEVALIHGRALEATYRQLLDKEDSRAAAIPKARAANNLARLQVHGARVLSPYQLLKAAFRIKGYEAICADLFDSALIYDEIHAYEPKRLALIIGQMGDLAARFGARLCVMSATLPTFLQEWLRAEVPDLTDPTYASSQEFKHFRRHRLVVEDGDLLNHLPEIAERARKGSVLVCCNTVRRAQEAYDRLSAAGVRTILLHGRFTGRDRLGKENLLVPGEEQDIVMVATQVVEVSLNVSFGTIFSDPAPLEALFQRFGRVNRFGKNHDLAPVHVFTEPLALRVYSPALVGEAVRVLRQHDGQPVDEGQLTNWLDDQYTADILAPIQDEYARTLRLMRSKLGRLAPFQSDPELREEFFEMFDSVEILPASLESEYLQFVAGGETIEADSLLVSIHWGQWTNLERQGLTRPRMPDSPEIADVPYDSEYGLHL